MSSLDQKKVKEKDVTWSIHMSHSTYGRAVSCIKHLRILCELSLDNHLHSYIGLHNILITPTFRLKARQCTILVREVEGHTHACIHHKIELREHQ